MSIIDTPLVPAERAGEKLNLPPLEPKSTMGDLGVEWLYNAVLKKLLKTGAREYQREKVASVEWKQAIIATILNSAFARIPQVHIRVIAKDDGTLQFELVDGQQRMTAITDFLSGKFPLGDLMLNGTDVSGMYFEDLETNLKLNIEGYRISCIWYESLDEEDVADLFVNILNNTNNLTWQEKRNALRSHLISYCRDLARPEKGKKTIALFERYSKNEKEFLEHYNLNLRGRMELDEWILECCYFIKNGTEKGLTQLKLTKWVQSQHQNEYASVQKFSRDKKVFDEFWAFTYKIVKNTPKEYRSKLNGMTTQMLALYAWELKQKYGKIDYAQYTAKFFDIYTRWDKTGPDALYLNETEADGTQMPPFHELFGGKNANAIKTIWKVLDKERGISGSDSFGVTELDPRVSFPHWQIIQKWEEQDRLDGYDGQPLDEDNLAGDHDIPRSWGIKAGGRTEYDNLVVTSVAHNAAKSNMTGDDYRKLICT